VNTTAAWCDVCQNSQDRGCGALTLAAQEGYSDALSPISLVGAGFLGAGLTLAVVVMSFAALAFLGWLSFGKKSKQRKVPAEDDEVRSRKKLPGWMLNCAGRATNKPECQEFYKDGRHPRSATRFVNVNHHDHSTRMRQGSMKHVY